MKAEEYADKYPILAAVLRRVVTAHLDWYVGFMRDRVANLERSTNIGVIAELGEFLGLRDPAEDWQRLLLSPRASFADCHRYDLERRFRSALQEDSGILGPLLQWLRDVDLQAMNATMERLQDTLAFGELVYVFYCEAARTIDVSDEGRTLVARMEGALEGRANLARGLK